MKNRIEMLVSTLKPYKGILYFLTALFATHFFWKLVVDGDLNGQQIAIFGTDLTSLFYRLSQWTAYQIYWFSCLFPGTGELYLFDTKLYFWNARITLNIIWGCTGVKQAYVFATTMLFYSGPWKKKLWYIPTGIIILWAYNIARVSSILFLTRHHPERFDSLHEGVFRYVYYGLIFLLWVYWEEKIRKTETKK